MNPPQQGSILTVFSRHDAGLVCSPTPQSSRCWSPVRSQTQPKVTDPLQVAIRRPTQHPSGCRCYDCATGAWLQPSRPLAGHDLQQATTQLGSVVGIQVLLVKHCLAHKQTQTGKRILKHPSTRGVTLSTREPDRIRTARERFEYLDAPSFWAGGGHFQRAKRAPIIGM